MPRAIEQRVKSVVKHIRTKAHGPSTEGVRSSTMHSVDRMTQRHHPFRPEVVNARKMKLKPIRDEVFRGLYIDAHGKPQRRKLHIPGTKRSANERKMEVIWRGSAQRALELARIHEERKRIGAKTVGVHIGGVSEKSKSGIRKR